MENSRKIERQKFFKNPHVETVETENRIFVENWLGKISDTQKNFRNFGRFPSFHELWKTLLKVFGKSVENRKNSLKSAHFFSLKSAHFSRKNGLYRHNPAAYCGICSRFFKTGNRKFVCIKWKNEARKTAIHLPLMGLGFDVFDDIFYQLL